MPDSGDRGVQSCPICGRPFGQAQLAGHLERDHDRDGGAVNPAPETKQWPPVIETK